MPKIPRFKPPEVTSPPSLIRVEWVDASGDEDFDGPASSAGELMLLPLVGFHVRTAKGPHGPFVVISREFNYDEDKLCARFITTIPTGWIKSWSILRSFDTLYPPPLRDGALSPKKDTSHA